jgi:aspartate-semialdehyde dehydrogenase
VDGRADPLPTDVAGTDLVRVARLRSDPDRPNVYHMWIVADNLRKGAATNAVQIASLVRRG